MLDVDTESFFICCLRNQIEIPITKCKDGGYLVNLGQVADILKKYATDFEKTLLGYTNSERKNVKGI
jgi:hypothetical protein